MQAAERPGGGELDQITLSRAKRGEAAAQRALVVRYQRPVHGLLYRMLGGQRALVDDLSQETFLRVFGSLQGFSFDGSARLSTWILTIATRLALNELRRARIPLLAAEPVGEGDRPDRAAERKAVGRAVQRAVDALSPEHRSVVVLREYHDFDYDEIARALEIDLGTVKSRLSRARRELKEALSEIEHG